MYQPAPAPQAAAAPVDTETAQAQQTINKFLSTGHDGIKIDAEDARRTPRRSSQQFLAYPSVTQVPLSDLQTNPSASHGESARRRRHRRRRSSKDATRTPADAQGGRRALQLQSIMRSDTRKACMINNTLYSEGQQIEQFTDREDQPGGGDREERAVSL